MSADFAQLRQLTRSLWGLGDYRPFAALLEPAAGVLLDACASLVGQRVLDIGTGDGNCAIAAARRGARVVASDPSPVMLRQGLARAEAEGLDIEWVEADVEDLPFADHRFDAVISAFGAIFAARPELAASEMLRVLAPSGTLAMANWTPDGFSSRAMAIVSRSIEAAMARFPDRALATPPSPFLWGDRQTVQSRFEPMTQAIELTRQDLLWELRSFTVLQSVFEGHGGGLLAKRMLPADVYQQQIAELKALVGECNEAADGRVVIRNRYLLVLVRKP